MTVRGYRPPVPGFPEALAAHPTFPALLTAVQQAAHGSPHLDPATRSAVTGRVAALLTGATLPTASPDAHPPTLAFAAQLVVDVRALDPALVHEVRHHGGDAAVVAAASLAALTAAVTRAQVALGGS